MTELSAEIATYFPYAEVRPYQNDFMEAILEAVENGRSALIEGSNGLGKTIAALSACLPKAEENDLKILYVARTHRQHDRVIEELKAIAKRLRVSGISVRGRHEMCPNSFVARYESDARSVMEACEMLKARDRCQYYRSIEEREEEYSDLRHRIALFPSKASEIQKICRRRGFCPYELVKGSLPDARVIALSYLYVFDPEIRNIFLKYLGTPMQKIILIVDEAHNLPEVAAEIAGSRLSLFTLERAKVEAEKFHYKDIANFVDIVRSEVQKATEKIGKEALVSPEFLLDLVRQKTGVGEPQKFFQNLNAVGYLIKRALLTDGKYPKSYIHTIGDFLSRWVETVGDESFVNVISRYRSRKGLPTARLEIVALDPSKITSPVFSSVYSNILISGTLQPLEAHAQITRLPVDTVKKVVPSPFPEEHVLPLVSCGVTTAMERRTSEMYAKIASRILEVVKNTPVNTGVFAASFQVLQALCGNGLEKALRKPFFREHRGMSSRENENMVADFKACAKRGGAVFLGVQGGRSSEGVDYPGDEMNSVVIVGVPYAEPTPRVKAQIDYFEKRFPEHGREYGYVIPAMKKASQAAGRPIRTLEDRAAMIFLDHRFSTPHCQRFLPPWIRDNLKILSDEDGAIARELAAFFRTGS